jgi:hypothetical protein
VLKGCRRHCTAPTGGSMSLIWAAQTPCCLEFALHVSAPNGPQLCPSGVIASPWRATASRCGRAGPHDFYKPLRISSTGIRALCSSSGVPPSPPCRCLQVTYSHGGGTQHTVAGLLSARDAGIVCDVLTSECAVGLGAHQPAPTSLNAPPPPQSRRRWMRAVTWRGWR